LSRRAELSICIPVPKANGRVIEKEYRNFSEWYSRNKVSALSCDLSRVLKRDCAVPTIVILTKYDMFVTSELCAAGHGVASLEGEIGRIKQVRPLRTGEFIFGGKRLARYR
jgi:hypothetical protein